VVLAAPLALGFLMQHYTPNLCKRLHIVLKYVSLFALFMFIFMAVFKNHEHFIAQFWVLFAAVFAHNVLAMATGYAAASFGKLAVADKKAITLEVGMQNSALAIAIVFTQFNGEYGMALISAFWGMWHIVSGLAFVGACRYTDKKRESIV
jgi:BASS family bile acid:Na+ symporter